ncbi:tail fiber domain-containing protein [Kiritimatiellaeota bacterium B1221]|nr:tail fiber domain-containing protein [Kiritimatiellaeota bacterium B1221]
MKPAIYFSLSLFSLTFTAVADQVITDDLIVDGGSIAVGTDSVNGEDFGYSTVLLKENNLRIRFQDTSNSAAFPSNDWELLANDSSNGGENKFSIVDVSADRTPFTVLAGAREHALLVGADGNVGFGTAAPDRALHIVADDSPTIRLDQGNAGGLAAQSWDLTGNESGLLVQDVTNGGEIPFRIRSGAEMHSLTVGANGVGVGVSSAVYKLHVQQTEDLQTALIESTNAVASARTVLQLRNNGPAGLRISNNNATASPSDWDLTVNDTGELVISRGGGALVTIDATGNLVAAGTLSDASDVNRKEGFGEVDHADVLEKVADLPLKTWRYKGEDVTHIGPMAQDFQALFKVGGSARSISKADADGVALASIQALHADAKEKALRIAELSQQNQALEARLKRLESLLEAQ